MIAPNHSLQRGEFIIIIIAIVDGSPLHILCRLARALVHCLRRLIERSMYMGSVSSIALKRGVSEPNRQS